MPEKSRDCITEEDLVKMAAAVNASAAAAAAEFQKAAEAFKQYVAEFQQTLMREYWMHNLTEDQLQAMIVKHYGPEKAMLYRMTGEVESLWPDKHGGEAAREYETFVSRCYAYARDLMLAYLDEERRRG